VKTQTSQTEVPAKSETEEIQEFRLSGEFNNFFVLGHVNYSEPKIYRLRLRKGQRIEIAAGWRDLETLQFDPQGIVDQNAPGFQIDTPDGIIIKPRKLTYIMKARTDGVYRIIVAPVYKKLYKVNLEKGSRIDYTFKIYFTLL
jgi:hypothetical protein